MPGNAGVPQPPATPPGPSGTPAATAGTWREMTYARGSCSTGGGMPLPWRRQVGSTSYSMARVSME